MRITRDAAFARGSARRLCRRLFHLVYRPYALRRMAAEPQARVGGRTLLTDPEVFHPVYFLSTRVLIDYLRTVDLAGKHFLDMGTGTGSVGLYAESRGAVVTACDVNPRAVEVAAENARRAGARMETLRSDLFAALPGRRFDVICFNLPFYPGTPRTPLEAAFYGGPDFETIRAFAAGCAEALAPDGRAIVIFSEDSGRDRMLALFAAADLAPVDERAVSKFFELFHIVALRPHGRPPS